MAETGGYLAEQIRQLRDTCKDLRSDLESHDKDLYRGNGKPGITTRLQQLEDRVSVIEQSIKEFKGGQKWMIRLLLGALAMAALNLVIHH